MRKAAVARQFRQPEKDHAVAGQRKAEVLQDRVDLAAPVEDAAQPLGDFDRKQHRVAVAISPGGLHRLSRPRLVRRLTGHRAGSEKI